MDHLRHHHDALLAFIGFDDVPPTGIDSWCQLLLTPTFDQTAVIRFVDEVDVAHLEVAILEDSKKEYELFEFVSQSDSVEPIPKSFQKTANCIEELIVLGEQSRRHLAEQLRSSHALSLPDLIDQNTRDGLVVRCDLSVDDERQQFVVHVAQAANSLAHLTFIGEILTTCRAGTELAVVEEYLKTIEQYVGSKPRP